MKIVHVCICGIFGERLAYQENLLAKHHALLGHDVTVIAPTFSSLNADGTAEQDFTPEKVIDNGIKVIRLRPLFNNYKITYRLHLYKGLHKAIISEKPDLLFVHDISSFNYLCIPKIKKELPAVRIAFDNHGDMHNSCQNVLSKFLNGFLYKNFLVKRLVKVSDYFYGVTNARCDFLHDIYGVPESKIHLLVMGADDEHIDIAHKTEIRNSIRKNYNIEDDDFLIVTGGKIDRIKRIYEIITAVKNNPNPKIKLLFFGSIAPDLKEEIEGSICDKIIYIGWIDSTKVYDYFFAADFVIFPGLHSVMWEQAVATGTPCAFNHIKGFEHVNLGGNCILLEDNTVEYYNSIIEDLYSNKEKYGKIKAAAENADTAQFLYSNIAKKVINDLFPERT